MTPLLLLLAVATLLHGYVAWSFWAGFRARRHPFSIIAAFEPLGWLGTLAYALSPAAPARVLSMALALSQGAACALVVWLGRHNAQLKEKWDARAKAMGGAR